MKAIGLLELTKKFSIEVIEKHLVSYFIEANNIRVPANSYIQEYLSDYKKSALIFDAISALNHTSVEQLSMDMELLIPTEDKKINGAFFTPAYIVDYIIESVAPKITDSVIDISCGSGAFLIGVVRYFQKKFNVSIKQIVENNLFGADILSYNVNRCKILITLFGLLNGEDISDTEINVHTIDSLKHKWNRKFECVVGNPPYVKFQDLDVDTRSFLSSNWETTQFGTYNLYFAFFELGYNILSDTGRLGYITPNNYFTSLAGEILRNYFQRKQCVFKIVDFNSIKVFDAQTYTAITFLSKERNDYIQYARIGNNQHPEHFLFATYFTSNFYSTLSAKKWRLLCGNERQNIEQIESIGKPIGELFNICAGIATLKDEVFFVVPDKEDADFYYFTYNGNSYKVEKAITRAVIKISEFKSQKELNLNNRRIIYPYKYVKGKATPISEDEMKSTYPNAYNYLSSVKPILDSRGKGKQAFNPFYVFGRTQGLNRSGIKLLTPTFSKFPRFLLDKDETAFFTNGYGVYLNPRMDQLFESSPISEPENLDVVQRILNSMVMHYYVTKTSVAIDGGYPCYQKNFIEKFTIPNLNKSDISAIREMSDSQFEDFIEKTYQISLPEPNLDS